MILDNIMNTITISMISYNDEKILEDCLQSVRNQDYNQDLVDILLVDGGSTDKTKEIATQYSAKMIERPDLKEQPFIRGGIAFTEPKTDFLVFFSADNRFQETDILTKMVNIMCGEQEIVGIGTQRYGIRKGDPILSRYFALIGGNDPIAISLGKADRGPYDKDDWHTYGEAKYLDDHILVSFEKDISKIPTLGANGFMLRTKYIKKSSYFKNALHIDACADLILQGNQKFAFLKNRHVVHYMSTGIKTLVKRRMHWASVFSKSKLPRLYSVYSEKDLFSLIKLTLGYLTILPSFLRALKGYIKYKDKAWFLHPVIGFIFVVTYGINVLKQKF